MLYPAPLRWSSLSARSNYIVRLCGIVIISCIGTRGRLGGLSFRISICFFFCCPLPPTLSVWTFMNVSFVFSAFVGILVLPFSAHWKGMGELVYFGLSVFVSLLLVWSRCSCSGIYISRARLLSVAVASGYLSVALLCVLGHLDLLLRSWVGLCSRSRNRVLLCIVTPAMLEEREICSPRPKKPSLQFVLP